MAINFPDSPTLNQIALVGSSYYIWNGTSWVGYSTSFTVNYNASSIVVQGNGSPLGATTTLNFSTNLTTTYDASGIATVTGSTGGGSSQWVTTAAGIHTLSNVGIGTTNPTSALTVKGNTSLETLNVSGVSTFPINVAVGVDFTHQGGGIGKFRISGDGVYGNGRIGYYDSSNNLTAAWDSYPPTGSIDIYNYTNSGTQNITISAGSSVVLQHGGTNTKLQTLGTGVTITGTTFTNQLSVSGVSTFSGVVGIATTNPITQLQVGRSGTQSGFGTFSASVGVSTTIDTFETLFLTAEYTVHIGYGTYIQAQKVLVMNNGSTAYSQEYAIMYEPSQIVSVGATVSGANVLLQVTPQTGVTGLTTYRFVRNSLI